MSTAFNLHPTPEEPEHNPPQQPAPPRRKHRWWKIAGWSLLGLVCFVIAAVIALGALVNLDGVHSAILNFAQKKATESLGTRVEIQNFVLRWSPFGLDLYGITVDGAGSHPLPPLAQIQHVNVGLRIVSLSHFNFYLTNLRVDHPVVWLYVDKNGKSNLPSLKSSSSSSGSGVQTLFNLGVRHAVLDRGEVYYNDRPKPLEADLHDLSLHARYSPSAQEYSGAMAYRDGHLKYGAYQPIPHDLSVSFALTPTLFQLKQAALSSGDSQAVLAATIHNYSTAPILQAQYHVTIDGAQMAKLLQDPSIPAGFIRAAGTMKYQKRPGPMLASVDLQGDLDSPHLDLHTSTANATIRNLAAHYSLANGNAALQSFHASLLGGDVTAQGTMTDLGGNSHSEFNAALHNISLGQLKQMAGKAGATPGVGLAGTLNATATAAWGKTMNDLVARIDAGIHADVSSRQKQTAHVQNAAATNVVNGTATPIPIESQIHGTYTRANGHLQLENSYLRTTSTNLTLNGTVSNNSSLAIRLQASDLSELAAIMNSFRPPAAGQKPLNLSGAATFQGNVRGSMSAPLLTGQLTATHLNLNGSEWKLVRTGVNAGPDHAALENALLQPASRGQITVNARAGLNKWAFTKQSPVDAQVNASQIDLASLMQLAGKQMPVTGTLNTHLDFRGSMMNPQGNGNVTLTGVTAYDQPLQSVKVNFSGNGQQARATLAVLLAAGDVHADVTLQPKQKTYTAQVTSSGIHLNKLEALQARNIKANGVLQLRAQGQGSFSNPALNANVQVPTLEVANQTLSALNLQLNMASHVANVGLTSTTSLTPIQVKATVQLTGDYMTDASVNTQRVDLKPLLALYSPSEAQNISGATELHATLHGPLKNFKQMEAHVTIPVLQMAYGSQIQLAAAAPIQMNYKNGVIDLPPAAIRGTDTDLTFQAHVPTASTAPMSVQVRGHVNLALAQLFNPDVSSSGMMNIDIDSHGALANGGDIGGQINLVNVNFADATMPVGLQNGNGVLKLTTDRVNIQSFEGTVGGGKVQLQGGVAYRPHLLFNLGLAAHGIRMLYPQGMRENIDANIRLNGSTNSALLAGEVNLTNLAFTPAFDLTSIAGQVSGGVAAPPSQGFSQNLRLNLAIHSSNNMNLVSRQMSVDGSANLQIRGTAAQPVVLGRVNITGGDMILNGNRFLLTGGTVQFVNPMETEPVLNMTISTTIQEYDITLRFQGPTTQMRTEYTSNPALPTADIIHLLAFGSTTEAAANNPTPASQEAESLVASQVSSQVTSRISRIAGISQLSVSPVLQGGTAEGPPGANITIRQRVTGKLFITFSTNVATTQDQIIQGQYQLSPRVALSATRDPSGGFAVDTLIKKTW
jgi:translocation and assembly module TamB